MKCKYCGIYLENVDEESPNGMAHTIKCQTKRIHELENDCKHKDGTLLFGGHKLKEGEETQ